MKLFAAKRRVYIYIAVNFMLGAMLGIVLFYAQQKNEGNIMDNQSVLLKKNIGAIDFLQLAWLNLLWLTAIPVSRLIAPHKGAHPIMLARGAICTFSVCCLLKYTAVLKAAAAVIPQCFSIFPAMAAVSGLCTQKNENGKKTSEAITRRELILMAVLSLMSAGVETLLYTAFLRIIK